MKKPVDKAYANINGIIQEFDRSVHLDDPVTKTPSDLYDFIGVGVVDSVCNIKTVGVGGKRMKFYKKKLEVKERKFGW